MNLILKAKEFKPAVLATYKNRFRQAVASFAAYLNDPGAWKPGIAERPAQRGKRNGNGERHAEKVETVVQPLSTTGLMEFPYPIREGLTAKFQLPRDIKMAEVKRISAFMATLAVDYEAV